MPTPSFIDQLYNQFLFREPDALGRAWWIEVLSNGQLDINTVTQGFINSTEFQNNVASIIKLHHLTFGKLPEQVDLKNWVNQIQQGLSLNDISSLFIQSDGFDQYYGDGVSDSDFIDQAYQNALTRAPDIESKNFWLSKLSAGSSRAELLSSLAVEEGFNNPDENQLQASYSYYGIMRRPPSDGELSNMPPSSSELITELYNRSDYIGNLPNKSTTVFIGDENANVIRGTELNDEIYGGGGYDLLIGSSGTDQLTGGDGSDRFQFSLADSTPDSMTTVTDFANGSLKDKIEIKGLVNYNYYSLTNTYSDFESALAEARTISGNNLFVFTVSSDNADTYIYLPSAGQGETLIKLQGHSGIGLSRHDSSIRTFLEGSENNDVINHSGSLDSYIDAGSGDDYIWGGSQQDHILLGAGNDIIDGRDGNDLLVTSEAAAIINGSSQSLNINGLSIEPGVVVGTTEAARSIIGQDKFSNFEGVFASDGADFIAEGVGIRDVYARGGDDIILSDSSVFSSLYGGSGQDTFVFQSGNSINSNWYDSLVDFTVNEDRLLFVTNGSYQVSSEIKDYGELSRPDMLLKIQSDSSLENSVMVLKQFGAIWLYINGDGGLNSEPSLDGTLVEFPDLDVSNAVEVTGSVSFVTEIPSII